MASRFGTKSLRPVELSKIDDYLWDNLCVYMLSEVVGEIKKKADEGTVAVSNRESRAHPLRKVRGEGWATRLAPDQIVKDRRLSLR
jgi:hypothetical protein